MQQTFLPATALVTGATSGFGRAIAQHIAQHFGWDLVITGRRADRLQALAVELQTAYGIRVFTRAFDVRDKAQTAAAITGLEGEMRHPLRVLVNNAGLAAGLAPIDEGELSDWDQMIDTNLKGLLYVTHAVLPHLKAAGGAHIVNIGSTAAKLVYRNANVYSATKAAVDSLSQGMRIDLLPYGIKVTAVHPGAAETEFSEVRFKGDIARAEKVYEGFTPLYAEDVAQTVGYCLSLPAHVCINDLTMTCLTQANGFYSIKAADLKGPQS